jgi:hypothetical protein
MAETSLLDECSGSQLAEFPDTCMNVLIPCRVGNYFIISLLRLVIILLSPCLGGQCSIMIHHRMTVMCVSNSTACQIFHHKYLPLFFFSQ